MNGACIGLLLIVLNRIVPVFFLLFGVCVICNCAARKPKFHGSEQKEKKRKKPTVSRLVAVLLNLVGMPLAALFLLGNGSRRFWPARKGKCGSGGRSQGRTERDGHKYSPVAGKFHGQVGVCEGMDSSSAFPHCSRRGSAASIRLDQNGNGGQGGGGPLVANHRSPTPRSFRVNNNYHLFDILISLPVPGG